MRSQILMVEDDPTDMHLWKELFSESANAPEIFWVRDGREAMDFLQRQRGYEHAPGPDLIVMDLNLPCLDGYQLLQLLKTKPEMTDIPVIVLTTSNAETDRKQCQDYGAAMFLTKPHRLLECQELVTQLTEHIFPKLAKH